MLNNNGFTFIEALISFNIVFLLVVTIIPITSLLHKEGKLLNDRRQYTANLHDELQLILWSDQSKVPITYTKKIDTTNLTFTFQTESEFIEGCVMWKNIKKKREEICLYGYMP